MHADYSYQTFFTIIAKNSEPSKEKYFKKVIFETLEKLSKQGIDKDLLEGAINREEFAIREGDTGNTPKGLIYNEICLDSWFYEGEPFAHLHFDEVFKKIKSGLENNYFENLIEKYLLNNKHRSLVVLKPHKGLAEKEDEGREKILKEKQKDLTKKELQEIIKQTEDLKEYQEKENHPDDVAKISKLKIEDISKNPEVIPQEKHNINNCTVLHHPIQTNNISYMQMYFDTSHIPKNKVHYLNLMRRIISRINTNKRNYLELNNLINKYTGGISFYTETFELSNEYKSKLIVKSKCLDENFGHLINLLHEIVNDTVFDDKKRIKEIIEIEKSNLESQIISSSDVLAYKRVKSYFSNAGRYSEYISGLEYYNFICNLEENFDALWDNVKKELEDIKNKIFSRNELLVNITCEKDKYKEREKLLKTFLNDLKEKKIHLVYTNSKEF